MKLGNIVFQSFSIWMIFHSVECYKYVLLYTSCKIPVTHGPDLFNMLRYKHCNNYLESIDTLYCNMIL